MGIRIKLLLKGGKVHAGNDFIEADILISDGRIQKIERNIDDPADSIDCSGKFICPGFIDSHVHFREPGATHKEDFLSGSKAAVSGGITTVLDMPNTSPPVVTQQDLELKRSLAKKSLCNYGLYALGCRANMKSIGDFQGIPAVKVYLGSSTGGYLTDDLGVFVEILKNAQRPVVVHAENEQLIKYFTEQFKDSEMHHKMRDNLCAVTSVAESTIVASYLHKQLHIAHMSTREEVEFLRKNKTPNITCEVCPHHLWLTESFFGKHGNFGKMNPPLRYADDQVALWEGIKEGIVDIVATDHAPHTPEEKAKDFHESPCGVPGIQTMIPLLLNAVNQERLKLTDVIRLCAANPAKIFGIHNRGKLEVGCYADICIVDMEKEGTIRNESQLSKCGWTPFDGVNIKGWPVITIINGNLVFNNGVINESHPGMELEFGGPK